MFIVYYKSNGREYARLDKSKRDGTNVTKEYTNLGLVVDKEKNIFKNRKQGVFTFNPDDGSYGKPDPGYMLPSSNPNSKEKLILDFGDSYFLQRFIESDGLKDSIDAIPYPNKDTTYAMIFYYVLASAANCHAETWYEGNYVRIQYPRANIVSQRISDFLAEVGAEESMRAFFRKYFTYVSGKTENPDNILIDSTGLPNSIHFPLTAVSNHNGDIKSEVRLIYVTHQETGLPIYFRYVAGNIVDVSTLVTTIAELKASGMNTKFAIMDAGYYSAENATTLLNANISFISRLKETTNLYDSLLKEHLPTLESEDNLVAYNGRYVYIKCTKCSLTQEKMGYAYICRDLERRNSESYKLFKKAKVDHLDTIDVYRKMERQGVFILVSSRQIAKEKILPIYYTRQQIEQIFDIGKNYADMTPLRIRTEETFRGHLLITFIASVIVKRIQQRLLKTAYNPTEMFMSLRNQKCKVYENVVIAQEAAKKANDCYKLFKLKSPVEISLKPDVVTKDAGN